MARFISICDQGYRATVEEQDDTVVWITHMLQRNEGTDASLLLRGSAVNYAVASQSPPPVSFGGWTQKHPADIGRDLGRFMADGGQVYVLAEDVAQRGIRPDELIDGARLIEFEQLAGLLAEHQLVHGW